MGPALPSNWQDELEHLRREQNPGKYSPVTPDRRPALYLPLPAVEPPLGWRPPVNEPEAPRVLIVSVQGHPMR